MAARRKSMEDEKDLFVRLAKYKPTAQKNSLENFATELFVYLLKYCSATKNLKKISEEILQLFAINNLESTQITTQTREKNMQPDIIIEGKTKKTVIEVKIDASLEDEQLKKYKSLGEAFSLTKNYAYYVDEIEEEHKIRWHQIGKIVSQYKGKDILIDNFINFLEEEEMGKKEPIQKSVSNLIDALVRTERLLDLLDEALERAFPKSSSYKKKRYKENNGIGYYIDIDKGGKKKKEGIFFVGLLPSTKEKEYDDKIFFELSPVFATSLAEEKLSKDEEGVYFLVKPPAPLEITATFLKQDYDAQLSDVSAWLEQVKKELPQYVK